MLCLLMLVFLIKSLVVDVPVLYGGDGVFGSYDGDVAAVNLVDVDGVKWIFHLCQPIL